MNTWFPAYCKSFRLSYLFLVSCLLFFASVGHSSQNEAIVVLSYEDKVISNMKVEDRLQLANSQLKIIAVRFNDLTAAKTQLADSLKGVDVIRGLVITTHGAPDGSLLGLGEGIQAAKLSEIFMQITEPTKEKLSNSAKVMFVSCSTFCGLTHHSEAQAQQIIDWLGNRNGEVLGSTNSLYVQQDELIKDQLFTDNKTIDHLNKTKLQLSIALDKAMRPISIVLGVASAYFLVRVGLSSNFSDALPLLGFLGLGSSKYLLKKMFLEKMTNLNELISFKFENGRLLSKELIYPGSDQSRILSFYPYCRKALVK
jgi:hypothetical protein